MGEKSFTAGGKTYLFEKQLKTLRIHQTEHIYRDFFGRRVLLINERYPCFDEFDSMYENRYFHHYYIETQEGYVHVRTADDQDEIRVYEPVSSEDLIYQYGTWHESLLEAAGLFEEE